MRNALSLIVVSLVSFSCVASDDGQGYIDLPERGEPLGPVSAAAPGQDETAPEEPAPEEPEPDEPAPEERTGVLIPAEAEAISFWPEEYSGQLLVLKVMPHGSKVAQGDVVARLETRAILEQTADAQLGLEAARVQHQGLLQRNALAAEAADSQLARAEAALDRARRALEGFETREREFTRRSDALSKQRAAAWEADQVDELDQLEAMYEADELVDATEEIVLKRSRRDLASTRASNKLSDDRRAYRVEVSDEITLEVRREDVARKSEDLEHLRRTQAIDRRGREVAEKRSAAELDKLEKRFGRLERDRELFSVHAPRDGALLHGALQDWRKGPPARIERGSQLAARKDVFLIAEPGALAVALDVPESARASWTDGAAALVKPIGSEDGIRGKLAVANFPTGTKGEESTFEATVTLEASVPGLVPGMHASVVIEETEP